MDIRKFAVAQTSRLHLCDANDDPMYADEEKTRPITVNLYGPGSKQYAGAQAAQNNRMIDKLKRKGKAEQTAEQRAAEAAKFLSACTESWENMEYGDLTGDELSIAVYSDVSIGFIADQVTKHIGDWVNFTKPSTTN
ncbi:MAG: hypothetical protein JSR71_09380 [Proteobacteria bacterium]|nr:hypothetical protein [Pseudomonadota bacterium]